MRCGLIPMRDEAPHVRYAPPFFKEETAVGAMTVLSYRIKKYGIPPAPYGDHSDFQSANGFVPVREATEGGAFEGDDEGEAPLWEGL